MAFARKILYGLARIKAIISEFITAHNNADGSTLHPNLITYIKNNFINNNKHTHSVITNNLVLNRQNTANETVLYVIDPERKKYQFNLQNSNESDNCESGMLVFRLQPTTIGSITETNVAHVDARCGYTNGTIYDGSAVKLYLSQGEFEAQSINQDGKDARTVVSPRVYKYADKPNVIAKQMIIFGFINGSISNTPYFEIQYDRNGNVKSKTLNLNGFKIKNQG